MDTKSYLLADQVSHKNPIQYTPDDLDKETAYGLTRSPTQAELEEYARNLQLSLAQASEYNHKEMIKDAFEKMLKSLTKGGVEG
jgi:hypothetical protein